MSQPQSNTILNGPTGELTMAFKEAQKAPPINNPNTPNNQNFRPQLQRNDSRVQGGPQPQQFQGQPRPFQGPGPGQAPQFRPPNFQQQLQQQLQQHHNQRFGPPGAPGPNQGLQNQQGPPSGQPLFRPQQRFVAVNPPGTVRHNFRPPGPPGSQGPQGPHNFQGPQGPPGPQGQLRHRAPGPGLTHQQSIGGALPSQRSLEGNFGGPGELQRGTTLESATVPTAIDRQYEEKEEVKHAVPQMSSMDGPQDKPQMQQYVPPQMQPSPPPPKVMQSPPPATPSPTPVLQSVQSQPISQKLEHAANAPNQVNDSAPPSTLQLNSSLDTKTSSSPSPQPESVIEVKKTTHEKAPEEKPTSNADQKPPRVPKTPTQGGSTARAPSRNKKEGDNDSGVDESTQRADHSTNGDRTPRKSSRNGSRPPGGATPTKHRSFSRGSRSPHLMSPDSQPGTPGPNEKKKLPMNKIQVGAAPSPNLKVVKSKIGSLANTSYKPGGGHVKIETKKIDVSKAQSKIGAKNETYTPTGGDKKILSQRLQWNAKSKIGSLENANHKPKGGEKKIETVKLDFKDKAKPKVGSTANMQHVPGGGDVKNGILHTDVTKVTKSAKEKRSEPEKSAKIIDRKIEIQAESKIKSLDNVKHRPGGGEKKIFDDKEYLRQMSAGAMSNENNSMCGSQKKQQKEVENVVDSQKMLNVLAMMGKVVTILETVEENQRMILQSRPASRNSQKSPKRRPVSTPRIPWRY